MPQQGRRLEEDRHRSLGPRRLRVVHPRGALRQRLHDGAHRLGSGASRPLPQDLLPMRISGSRVPGFHRRLYAMQSTRLQTELPRHLRSIGRSLVRRGRQLHGQRQILRLLRLPLSENCEFPFSFAVHVVTTQSFFTLVRSFTKGEM